jgi:Lectin C-type domain/FG-GAP-like repeat
VNIFNAQKSYSTSFDDFTNYIDAKLANPDGDYTLNEVQLNEAIATYDVLGQRRDSLAKSVNDTQNVITLLSANVQQVNELNQKIQHLQDLTSLESFYANFNAEKIRLNSLNQSDYDWANNTLVNNVQSLFTILDRYNGQKVGANLKQVLTNYQSFLNAQKPTYTNLYQSYINIGNQADKNAVINSLQNLNNQGINVLISETAKALRPLLIDQLNQEVTNKVSDLPVQIDLTLPKNLIINPSNNHLYLLTDAKTWTEAQAEANKFGGNLVTINNAQEQQWLWNTFGTVGNYWIGLKRNVANNSWSWVNGESANYFNWDPREPNNVGGVENYGMIIGSQDSFYAQGKWNDYSDTNTLRGNGVRGIIEINSQNILEQKIKEQEQWIETNLQKYIQQKENDILGTLKISFDDIKNHIYGLDTFNPAILGSDSFGNLIWNSQDSYPRYLADVNGDGKADTVGFGSDGVYVALAKGDGTFNPAKIAYNDFGINYGWTNQNLYPRFLADVNGDKKADIVSFASSGVYVALAKGDGTFDTAKLAYDGFGINHTWANQDTYPRYLADVNGDGKADIVGFAYQGVYVALANGNGTFQTANLAYRGTFTVGDGGWTNNTTYPRFLADVNGDGKADIVGFAYQGVYVALANGNGTFATPKLAYGGTFTVGDGGWISQDIYPRYLADVNGDGKADIVGFASNGVWTALAKGDGTFNQAQFVYNFFGTNQSWGSQNGAPRQLADVNGDGKADIVGFAGNGVIVALNNVVKKQQEEIDAITKTAQDKAIADLESLRLETADLVLQANKNPDTVQKYLQEYQTTPKTETALKTLLNKYFPELNNVTTLATLQQQITNQLTDSQKQLQTIKNTIAQNQASANAALDQAKWYEQEAPFFYERSHKQGPVWIEYRRYKQRRLFGSKWKTVEIRHVDQDWLIYDTYTKQAANLKQYAADLLKGVETSKTQQDTVTTILQQWNNAKSVADDAQITYDQLLAQLQQLEAEKALNPDKLAQLDSLQKLLPTLKTQLAQAEQEFTTAKTKVTQEWGEYQTSANTYQTALNDVLKNKATLETKSQQLLAQIKETENWIKGQLISLDVEVQDTTNLKQQLTTKLAEVVKQIDGKSLQNDLLIEQTSLQESLKLLTHKETILTAQKTTLTQKQTLLDSQKNVIQIEQKLLIAYLQNPDNDNSNLEAQLKDSRAAFLEAQRLAKQAETNSEILTASMDDLQTFLQLQNDKYLTAVKDKQNALKAILDATELKENYSLQTLKKQEDINAIESKALELLQTATDAGNQEAKKILDATHNQNIAAGAEIYYKDYTDLASDKGGGCAGGLAKPEDRIFADHYYQEMVTYRQLAQAAKTQAEQFAKIKQNAQDELNFVTQQQILANQELADLKAQIGNAQNTIDEQQKALNIAQLRVDALGELRNWTEQTLNQLLQVENLNLAQAKLQQTIAQERQKGINTTVAQQLERDRLSIERQKAIANVKLEQLTQITAEDTLQNALNDLRSDLGLTPVEDFIKKAEWKANLVDISVDLESLKQQKEFSAELKSLLNAASQDIQTALQGKEAKTIQENLLKTADALIKQTNSYQTAIAALEKEEQNYLTLQQNLSTKLQDTTKLLLAEIDKTGKLDSEIVLLNQQNLTALYKVANAKNAQEISASLAQQSQDILNQIIDGRIAERKARKKVFINELLAVTSKVLGILSIIPSPLSLGLKLASLAVGAAQAAINGDWKGAIFNAAMGISSFIAGTLGQAINAGETTIFGLSAETAKNIVSKINLIQPIASGLYYGIQDLKSGDNIGAFLQAVGALSSTVLQLDLVGSNTSSLSY